MAERHLTLTWHYHTCESSQNMGDEWLLPLRLHFWMYLQGRLQCRLTPHHITSHLQWTLPLSQKTRSPGTINPIEKGPRLLLWPKPPLLQQCWWDSCHAHLFCEHGSNRPGPHQNYSSPQCFWWLLGTYPIFVVVIPGLTQLWGQFHSPLSQTGGL